MRKSTAFLDTRPCAPPVDETVEAFFDYVVRHTTQHPLKPRDIHARVFEVHSGHEVVPVLLEIKPRGDSVRFDSLMVPSEYRGRKAGTVALLWLVSIAQRYNVRLVGHVEPFGTSPAGLNRTQLKAWYKRHGFLVSRTGLIVLPRKDTPA